VSERRPFLGRSFGLAVIVAAVALAGAVGRLPTPATGSARAVPAPALDVQPGSAPSEVAVLAGGCFWGVEVVAGVREAQWAAHVVAEPGLSGSSRLG
jgi:hypothetical protein